MKVAFVCLNAAELFVPVGRFVGGTERQQARLGRELARRGHRIAFVVREAEGLASRDVALVPVRTTSRPRVLARVLNAARLWGALRRTVPDVVVQQGAGPITLDVACFARARGCPFVFMAAHDDDFRLRLLHTNAWRNRQYRWGAGMADALVVQTERQRALARACFGREGDLIPNPMELPAAVPPPGEEVLWVGTLRPEKRPGALLDLARALPGVRFTVVGAHPPEGAPGADEARAFAARAAALPNVTLAGFQPPEAMDGFYDRAAVVVNTSVEEGFSNVLLEAWARGRPVVTADVDPDEVICRLGLGVHAGSLAAMAPALEGLLADPGRRRRLGEAGRRYVEAQHAVGPVADRFEALFDRLIRARTGAEGLSGGVPDGRPAHGHA